MTDREQILLQIRYVDVQPQSRGGSPATDFTLELDPGETVISVETVKDAFGYASARVWIAQTNQSDGAK